MNPDQVLEVSGGNCGGASGEFFNVPTWYKYLTCNEDGDPQIEKLMDVWSIVAGIIDILLYVGGAAAILFIVYGGIRLVMSQGQPDRVAQAKQTLIYAAAGLIITIIARAVVTYVFSQF